MHEIRATIPLEHVDTAARLANEAGITTVAVSDVYLHGRRDARKIVTVETSTPRARAFVDALLASPHLRDVDYSLTSRELRAIMSSEDVLDLTRPMSEPFPDVIQDLWQLSHLTVSYIARAAAGAILLATGIGRPPGQWAAIRFFRARASITKRAACQSSTSTARGTLFGMRVNHSQRPG